MDSKKWKLPPENTIKMNFDGAWDKCTLDAGGGVVCRDHNGSLVAGYSEHFLATSPIEAEARALVIGLNKAIVLGCDKIIVEGDNKELMMALSGSDIGVNWTIYPFIRQIRRLQRRFSTVSWFWINREANRAADAAAKLGKRRLCISDWTSSPPPSISNVLSAEGLPEPP